MSRRLVFDHVESDEERADEHLAVEIGRQPGMGSFEQRLEIARRLRGRVPNKIIQAQTLAKGRHERSGAKLSETQRKRRKGKPANDPADTSRDDRIRARHARLRAQGRHDATSAVAIEFSMSTRNVRRIIRAG